MLNSQYQVDLACANEIAILSCAHKGNYDVTQAVSHEIALNLPCEPESSAGGFLNKDCAYFFILVECFVSNDKIMQQH